MDPQISPFISVGSCLFLSIIYVSSLYIWNYEHNRDHPSTVKKRFFSVFIVMLISPIFVRVFSSSSVINNKSIWELMGFRISGLLPAIFIPLGLTSLLFLGPLAVQVLNGAWKVYFVPQHWLTSIQNMVWLRNHIVAPLSEEFTFRACMMALLMQSFTPFTSVLITPLFFGVAHFHHIVERLRDGMNIKTIIIISCFQFTYTTVFGVYSAYLFAKTGHFVAPFIAHAFCNHMGFPDIQEIFNQTYPVRSLLLFLYVLGLIGWLILTPVMTEPSWFGNNIHWTS